jgi:ADP-ribose pyrophosphatase YjhB (NUDIX family)
MKDVTLLFIRTHDQILLAMKKRGFGQGKWNGVGGKTEPGETIETAAIRECQEEIGVTPHELQQVGNIQFRMSHDPSFGHHAYIFISTSWDGNPIETDEMRPQWFPVTAIPYASMWAADAHWLPFVIQGKSFRGKITFGPHDEVVTAEITELPR